MQASHRLLRPLPPLCSSLLSPPRSSSPPLPPHRPRSLFLAPRSSHPPHPHPRSASPQTNEKKCKPRQPNANKCRFSCTASLWTRHLSALDLWALPFSLAKRLESPSWSVYFVWTGGLIEKEQENWVVWVSGLGFLTQWTCGLQWSWIFTLSHARGRAWVIGSQGDSRQSEGWIDPSAATCKPWVSTSKMRILSFFRRVRHCPWPTCVHGSKKVCVCVPCQSFCLQCLVCRVSFCLVSLFVFLCVCGLKDILFVWFLADLLGAPLGNLLWGLF